MLNGEIWKKVTSLTFIHRHIVNINPALAGGERGVTIDDAVKVAKRWDSIEGGGMQRGTPMFIIPANVELFEDWGADTCEYRFCWESAG